MGVLQVRGCSLIKRKIPFLRCCSSTTKNEEEKGRRRTSECRRGLTFTRARGEKSPRRLPGWLARYVSGMHAQPLLCFIPSFFDRCSPYLLHVLPLYSSSLSILLFTNGSGPWSVDSPAPRHRTSVHPYTSSQTTTILESLDSEEKTKAIVNRREVINWPKVNTQRYLD